MNKFFLLRMGITLAVLLLSGLVTRYLLKRTFPRAWEAWMGAAFRLSMVAMPVGFAVWTAGRAWKHSTLSSVGVYVVASLAVGGMVLLVSAPLWMGLGALAAKRRRDDVLDPRRRQFLQQAAGAVPVAAVATGPLGATAAMLNPVVRSIQIPVRGLPAGLSGLKILQLTDVHLGTFIDVEQVRVAVEKARPTEPHLVVLTGDIADDYTKLPAALEAVGSLGAPLGAFAIFGNHEIYRGRQECRDIYKGSPVRLLCEEGVLLEHQGEPLWLGGADDPATLGREHRPFLQRTVERALEGCPSHVKARILLSHRPEGFEEAARRGVTLTLSGHTHGAQAAFFGRSWLEWLMPNSYLLGHYQRGDSHLYTSAGLGHWLPFRLNCPCEVALIELHQAPAASNARPRVTSRVI